MNDKHLDQFERRAIVDSFYTEERCMQFRSAQMGGTMLPDTESVQEYEDIVRDEAERLENSANVVTAITVEDYTLHLVILLGQSADEEIISRMVEDMERRIYERNNKPDFEKRESRDE